MSDETIGEELHQLGQDAQNIAETVVGDVKSVFVDSEKVILTALGHAHNLISGLTGASELASAKSAIESAIISFAKHLGL